jgi:hypothetical protein
MRQLPRSLTSRRLAVAVLIVAAVFLGCLTLRWYIGRVMLRHEAADNSRMRKLYRAYETDLRAVIDRLLLSQANGADGGEDTDRIFELLRTSRVASNSREVERSEREPHSKERTAVALKWARVAADEAAFDAALRDRWAIDYQRGRAPHHITEDEIPLFKMPEGWTEDDLKFGR